MINIGRLRKRIKVYEFKSGTNALGQDTTGLKLKQTVWGEIHPLKGKEIMSANMKEAISSYKITMRYFSGLTEEMYLGYNNMKFQITSICNVDMLNKFYEVMCEEYKKKVVVIND